MAWVGWRLVEVVNGIGGFFFRAQDPEVLRLWYQERLGVKAAPETYEDEAWWQREAQTVFSPFQQDSE